MTQFGFGFIHAGPSLSASRVGGGAATTLNNNSTSASFSAVDLGAADANRWIVVFVGGYSTAKNLTNGVTAVTIGGVSATLHQFKATTQTGANNSPMVGAAIVFAKVPTGATGTIAVTWDGVVEHTCIHVWRLIPSTGNLTATNLQAPGTALMAAAGGGTTSLGPNVSNAFWLEVVIVTTSATISNAGSQGPGIFNANLVQAAVGTTPTSFGSSYVLNQAAGSYLVGVSNSGTVQMIWSWAQFAP